MDYDESYDELNTILGDAGDITFTSAEKHRALKKAWNDSYVVADVTDNSLVFTSGTRGYTKPDGFTTITSVGLAPGNSLASGFVSEVGNDLWEVQGDSLVFKNNANGVITGGYTLYIKGRKKLDWNVDTLDTTNLQEYVLALAGYNTLGLLGHKKANLFLKNDTSMAELITLKRELSADVSYLRGKLATAFEGS